MIDLSRPWPFGLGQSRWWISVGAVVVLLVLAAAFDAQISSWAQAWPVSIRDTLAGFTPYGESAWILIPAGGLFAVTALLALVVRWKLMRTMLWQLTVLYAFIFLGVGLPSLVTTIIKRIVGRGRPVHLVEVGAFGLRPNWGDWTYQSFPSGHATTAFALALVLGFISPRWFAAVLLVATAIAVSRVSGGFHFPSDIIAGAVVGVLGAYAVRWVFAGRGIMFERTPEGRIEQRPLSSIQRYITLRRRRIAPVRTPNRP